MDNGCAEWDGKGYEVHMLYVASNMPDDKQGISLQTSYYYGK